MPNYPPPIIGQPVSVQVSVRCQYCYIELGRYVENGRKTCLHVGRVILSDGWGECDACGAPWIWHSSDRQLEKIVKNRLTVELYSAKLGTTTE
jgi:hypothetical protein